MSVTTPVRPCSRTGDASRRPCPIVDTGKALDTSMKNHLSLWSVPDLRTRWSYVYINLPWNVWSTASHSVWVPGLGSIIIAGTWDICIPVSGYYSSLVTIFLHYDAMIHYIHFFKATEIRTHFRPDYLESLANTLGPLQPKTKFVKCSQLSICQFTKRERNKIFNSSDKEIAWLRLFFLYSLFPFYN